MHDTGQHEKAAGGSLDRVGRCSPFDRAHNRLLRDQRDLIGQPPLPWWLPAAAAVSVTASWAILAAIFVKAVVG